MRERRLPAWWRRSRRPEAPSPPPPHFPPSHPGIPWRAAPSRPPHTRAHPERVEGWAPMVRRAHHERGASPPRPPGSPSPAAVRRPLPQERRMQALTLWPRSLPPLVCGGPSHKTSGGHRTAPTVRASVSARRGEVPASQERTKGGIVGRCGSTGSPRRSSPRPWAPAFAGATMGEGRPHPTLPPTGGHKGRLYDAMRWFAGGEPLLADATAPPGLAGGASCFVDVGLRGYVRTPAARLPRSRGSRTSRRASPSMLNP